VRLPGSRPEPVDHFDPTPPDQLTAERLTASTSGKITYGTPSAGTASDSGGTRSLLRPRRLGG
jgi:hypothetical protein